MCAVLAVRANPLQRKAYVKEEFSDRAGSFCRSALFRFEPSVPGFESYSILLKLKGHTKSIVQRPRGSKQQCFFVFGSLEAGSAYAIVIIFLFRLLCQARNNFSCLLLLLQEKLAAETLKLAENLHAALTVEGKKANSIDTATPIDKIVQLLNALITVFTLNPIPY